MTRTISISGLIGLLVGMWAVSHRWMGVPANPLNDLDHTLGVIVLAMFACVTAGISIYRTLDTRKDA